MFIKVIYKDDPELSKLRRLSEADVSSEKFVLVNPDCYVRIMLEYIRNHCRLGEATSFDLCDETGALRGLLNLPNYSNGSELFENRRTYYIIVLKQESDRLVTIIPQVNRQNKMYLELKARVSNFLQIQDSGSRTTTSSMRMKATKK